MAKPQVLVFIDWYLPGYKAGGPVRSVANLVDQLRDRVDFHIVTTDTDYTEHAPYAGIIADRWTSLPGGEQVWYASRSGINRARWRQLLKEKIWDAVYINGIYSRWFSIEPLRVSKGSGLRRIVAVRGMLAAGPMRHGALKKRVFLAMMKLAGTYRGVEFQATNAEEANDIRRWIGPGTVVHLAPNLPRKLDARSLLRRTKEPGELRLVSVARIAVEKNTLFAIECLRNMGGRVTFDLYGPIYDRSYWEQCMAAIATLPSQVKVEHRGVIEPDRVPGIFSGYHALFMPSQGENFGHTMLEALTAGLPILISDRTPWKDLERRRSGWDLPLDRPEAFARTLQLLVDMSQADYERWSAGAFDMGARYLADPGAIESSLSLFKP